MTRYGRIYIIKNTVNDKVYVGQTKVSLKLRFQNHLSAARNGKDYIIGKAIRKYGEDKFYIELLEECTVEELNEREKYWIAFFNSTDNRSGYNISTGGNVIRTTKELDKDMVIKLFNSGIPAFKIAKILHTGVSNVTNLLRSLNIRYGVDLQKVDAVEEAMIIDLYLDGYSTVEIGNKFNRNKSTIRRVLLRNNINLRTFKETKNLGRNLPTL
jgi:transposase|nr:MAG TPA: intron associated endonuclease [Crassvirales sp.]